MQNNLPVPDWSRLSTGEFERTMLDRFAEQTVHPEREKQAAFWDALSFLVWGLGVALLLVLTPVIALVWKAAF